MAKGLTVERAKELLRARRAQRQTCWYPTATDLELPDVPWEAREDVREALHFLGEIPIVSRDGSWLIAQAIAELGDPRVQYVEGLISAAGESKVTPGAWNVVDGNVVCLFTEVKNRIDSRVWLFEPLQTYSLAEIYAARKAGHPACSAHEWLSTLNGETPDYSVLDRVFKEPLQRMLDRKKDCKHVEFDWK